MPFDQMLTCMDKVQNHTTMFFLVKTIVVELCVRPLVPIIENMVVSFYNSVNFCVY